MAEVELSVLSGQCLSQRISDEWMLWIEIAAWEDARDNRKAQIRWKFTIDDARNVFKQYYPTSLEKSKVLEDTEHTEKYIVAW